VITSASSLAEWLAPRAEGAGQFAGRITGEPWQRAYGGQILGQACAAAGATVSAGQRMHSFGPVVVFDDPRAGGFYVPGAADRIGRSARGHAAAGNGFQRY
jgi:hypothetical protein